MNNKSTFLILTIASLTVLLISQMPSDAFADVISPKKQTKIGINHIDIICKANLVKVYRTNADSFDCFTPSTAEKLIKMGITKDIPKDKLDAKNSFRQNPSLGTVTGLSTVKQYGSEGKLSSNPRVISYLYVFEVCANDKTIRAPEVLIKSDSEAKTVKLAQKIVANTCYTSTAIIKATNSDSISASLTNKGMVTDKITELEINVADLQQKLSVLKKSLSDVAKKDPMTLDDDARKKISDTTNEISTLRTQLNQAKGELNKYLFALNAPPQLKPSDFTKQVLTFTGVPLKDTTTNIMSISRQTPGNTDKPDTTTGLKLYNVVFEACTGNDVLRAPEVKVTSDNEEKVIRIAEKIIANSCQMSTVKINAKDTKSITLEIANRSDISAKIVELDKMIETLSAEQRTLQVELNKLVVQSEKPVGYEQKVTDLSNKIIKLRNEINDAKFKMYGIMYEIYKTL
ncbi:hypothetical protein [Nitrosopumilus ureiphilus]|uniref:Uncharacterized protein n=1 Tax=Nitrosopumilus ureiphilus TaxID=1470067 RepID=A0A7D5R9Y8_9ARCH|nr:hypothetical protein [Nitrosopumilus ureiphilus]QLH06024.1 hypothetical protein C5F50_02220 [Nitrosopumilus ureiphilus]